MHDKFGLAGFAGEANVAAIRADDDAMGDVQTQAGADADGFGGKERLEDALPVLF